MALWKRVFDKIRYQYLNGLPETVTDKLLPNVDEEVPYWGDKKSFIIKTKLGLGAYGAVYEVQRKSDGKKFAMKCEIVKENKSLPLEMKVMNAMKKRNSKHFVRAIEKGRMPGRFAYLVMEMVGKNLETLRLDLNPQRFTYNTSIKLAEQCLVAIENLHRAGFLHRDVKPANFAVGIMGKEDYHTVFMLDFSVARSFANKKKTVRAAREVAPFRGSIAYAPLAAHCGLEQSRKDDLESMMYMVVEWTSGKLPWAHGGRGYDPWQINWVLELKDKAYTEDSAKEKLYTECPRKQFEEIMKYLHELKYEDIPDYKFIYLTLTSIYTKKRISYADAVDWDPTTPYHGPQEIPGDGTPKRADEEEEDTQSQMSISEKGANSIMRTPRPTSRTVSVMSSPKKTP